MLDAVPLLAVTLGFISIFIWQYATLQIDVVKKDFQKRRCEPLVMAMAHLVKPEDDPKTPEEFSVDNFKFCIGKLIDSSISIFMRPVLKIFTQTMDTTKPISQGIGNLNGAAASLMAPLKAIFGSMWDKIQVVALQIARIFYKILSAFDRVFGISVASIFAGMAMYKAINNAMQFVINVCITILIILSILVIFLWFVMWPVIPIILTLIGVLSATVHAGRVSGLSGSFCVAPDTLVHTKKGWVEAESIRPGETLHDGALVEGVLKTIGGKCVSYKGVVLSESHLVWENEKWIPAGCLEGAKEVRVDPEALICLNTSSRIWEVRGQGGAVLTLRDWEEIPDSYDLLWEQKIHEMLNGKGGAVAPSPGRGVLGSKTKVYVEGKGLQEIRKVQIGDLVKDQGDDYTKVVGIYRDCSEFVPLAGAGPAIWVLEDGKWTHKPGGPVVSNDGWHLVTESGTFLIGGGSEGGARVVRDFTEVGWNRIHETYSFVEFLLNSTRNDSADNLPD